MALSFCLSLLLVVLAVLLSLVCSSPAVSSPQYVYPFQDPSLNRTVRIANLLSTLNLTEKISWLLSDAAPIPRLNLSHFAWGQECLHGVSNRNSQLQLDQWVTGFPQSIGLAQTWNTSVFHTIGYIIGEEARALHNYHIKQDDVNNWSNYLTCWTPVVNILKDSRWGRDPETYGEDPFFTYTLTSAYLHPLYGEDSQYIKIAPSVKHMTVYDGPEEGRYSFNVEVTDIDLYDTFNYVYRHLAEEQRSPAKGFMASYSAINGVPVACDFDLLTKQVRFDWGLQGTIVSDCDAVTGISGDHHYTKDVVSAAALALVAGLDINCGGAYPHLGEAIDRGLISEADIDVTLTRTIAVQMQLGWYDPPGSTPYDRIPASVLSSQEHQQQSLHIGYQTTVLLKNNMNWLPLTLANPAIHTILVFGPSANDTSEYDQCFRGGSGGCLLHHIYHAWTSFVIQPLIGIVDYLQAQHSTVKVVYSRGCERGGSDTSYFNETIALAKTAQLAIFIGGLDQGYEEEDTDRGNLLLPGPQTALVQAVSAVGIPVASVLLHGGPLSDPALMDASTAVLSVGYPGQWAGKIIADTVFGVVNPSGRLAYTTPTSVSQLPPIGDYHMTDGLGRTYRFFNATPYFYFGDGMSYTTYSYSEITLTTSADQQQVDVSVIVQNTGKRAGSEVIQLYAAFDPAFAGLPDAMRDPALSIPRRQLVAFDKVTLEAGQSVRVTLTVNGTQITALGRWITAAEMRQQQSDDPWNMLHQPTDVMDQFSVHNQFGILSELQWMREQREHLVLLSKSSDKSVVDRPITGENVLIPVFFSIGGSQPTAPRIRDGVVLTANATLAYTPSMQQQQRQLLQKHFLRVQQQAAQMFE